MSEDRPKGQQFVQLPFDLIASPAWASLSINAHRLVYFLMIEHMKKGGNENGALLAPRRELVALASGST
jgi:hypothetical protein